MQVCKWKIYISSAMRIMECILRSWLWVPSSIFINTRYEEKMLRQWLPFFLITIIYAEWQQLIHHSNHTSTLASWQMNVIQRERLPTVLLLLRRRKKAFGHVKRLVVLNRLSQVAILFAKDVTMNLCAISQQSI
jgi:hypothetical protein